MAVFNTDAIRWAAVQSKDPASDGLFVYCVKTTQIYCRPICKARLARRANVMFADSAEEAEKAGFRSCKRCKPDQRYHDPHADLVTRACLTIEENVHGGDMISLRRLATEAGLTESHFHRVFKTVAGVTPKEYAMSMSSTASVSAGSWNSSTGLNAPSSAYDAEDGVAEDFAERKSLGEASVLDGEAIDDLNSDQSELWTKPPLNVDFTIQPWSSFYVLIAVADNSICAIDTSDTYADLIVNVQKRFSQSSIHLSDWSKGAATKEEYHDLFDSVMRALENPTGNMVKLSPGAMEMYSVMMICG